MLDFWHPERHPFKGSEKEMLSCQKHQGMAAEIRKIGGKKAFFEGLKVFTNDVERAIFLSEAVVVRVALCLCRRG
mgnify:CR=1 FL=1